MTHKDTHNSVDYLLKVMRTLRAPEGCPWDIRQTPESLTPYIIEEACELVEAIDGGLPELILDELGDLLLQVVFQAQLFDEQQQFNFYDVATGIADKLVRRHPHVFSQETVKKSPTELDQQWDAIKRSELTNNKSCLADHLPDRLPTLQRAQKLVSRVYRGDRQAELPMSDHLLPKRVFCSADHSDAGQIDEESLGQALFQLVRLAHENNLDAEAALRKTIRSVIIKLDQ
jgi:MazG family protein